METNKLQFASEAMQRNVNQFFRNDLELTIFIFLIIDFVIKKGCFYENKEVLKKVIKTKVSIEIRNTLAEVKNFKQSEIDTRIFINIIMKYINSEDPDKHNAIKTFLKNIPEACPDTIDKINTVLKTYDSLFKKLQFIQVVKFRDKIKPHITLLLTDITSTANLIGAIVEKIYNKTMILSNKEAANIIYTILILDKVSEEKNFDSALFYLINNLGF